MGPDLMKKMRDQATRYGTEIVDSNVTSVNYTGKPLEVTTDDEKKYYSKSIIIATGADTKWLQIPGEQEKIGRGVSSCAPCDAAFYRNKKTVVIGGGDSAMEEAQVLSKFATEVYLIHRRDSFKASDIMQKKVFDNPKIKIIWNTSPVSIEGEMKVEKIKLTTENSLKTKINGQDKESTPEELGGTTISNESEKITWEFPTDGVFVAIGHVPNSAVFEGIEKDEKGFIKQFPGSKTNIEGVFVSGDVHDFTYMQAVTAAGFGCMAALDVERYLESLT
jgi:thioredoxin reductase (NADPH)